MPAKPAYFVFARRNPSSDKVRENNPANFVRGVLLDLGLVDRERRHLAGYNGYLGSLRFRWFGTTLQRAGVSVWDLVFGVQKSGLRHIML